MHHFSPKLYQFLLNVTSVSLLQYRHSSTHNSSFRKVQRQSALILHIVTHKPTLYVCNRQSSLNPKSNTMLPDRPQFGLSATREIAQQYSSSSIVPLRSHSRNQKVGECL